MPSVDTIQVICPKDKTRTWIINATDYDPEKYKLIGEPEPEKEPEKEPEMPAEPEKPSAFEFVDDTGDQFDQKVLKKSKPSTRKSK